MRTTDLISCRGISQLHQLISLHTSRRPERCRSSSPPPFIFIRLVYIRVSPPFTRFSRYWRCMCKEGVVYISNGLSNEYLQVQDVWRLHVATGKVQVFGGRRDVGSVADP